MKKIFLFPTICFVLTPIFLLISPTQADRMASRDSQMKSEMEDIFAGLQAFQKACGRYPTTQEGLKAVNSRPPGAKCSRESELRGWEVDAHGIFTRLKDSWNQSIAYKSDGKTYLIRASHGYSLTPDSPIHGNYHWTNPKAPPEEPPAEKPIPGGVSD